MIGHVATSDGLGIDPTKVKAIVDMPNPTDVPGVQRFLGLAKFIPHLSDMTKPLRELTRNETEWVWESPQQNALDTLKVASSCVTLLPSRRRSDHPVRCITTRTWRSIDHDADRPTGGLCITCSDAP